MLRFPLACWHLSTLKLFVAPSFGLPSTQNTEICQDDTAILNFTACWKCGFVFANNNHFLIPAKRWVNLMDDLKRVVSFTLLAAEQSVTVNSSCCCGCCV